MEKFLLSPLHEQAAEARRRNLLVYQDANAIAYTNGLVTSYDAYLKRMWDLIDHFPNQAGSIAWDAALFDLSSLSPVEGLEKITRPPYDTFLREGRDLFGMFVSESHSRGLEALLACRVGGGERFPELSDSFCHRNPQWYIHDWDLIPNLEIPEVCERKTRIYRRMLEKYGFDGIIIDFCRHTPFLTPGKQWEKRECVTRWLCSLRSMMLELEEEKGHPLFLGARVSPTVEGCRIDGLDIPEWARLQLVDLLVLGDRCYGADPAGFRGVVGEKIKLYPNLDAHHTTDGYFDPPVPVLAGTVHRWFSDGADGVSLFNWLTAGDAVYKETAGENYKKENATEQPSGLAFWSLAGDPEALSESDKIFVAERRGGYPWENGYTNNNRQNPLPVILKNNGEVAEIPVTVSAAAPGSTLSVTVYGLLETDRITLSLNGRQLELQTEHAKKDAQIFPLSEAPVSGFKQVSRIPDNKSVFDVFTALLPEGLLRKGKNLVSLYVDRKFYPYLSKVELERIHITVPGKQSAEAAAAVRN